ncbi:MAG TPA: hypothetical protein D7I12_01155 [Candidatus Poseidoniales archaeon]|nr:MAG TPA: hypothetical protein D7I12_01155 [Candidatus Poseidoniales archaeon]
MHNAEAPSPAVSDFTETMAPADENTYRLLPGTRSTEPLLRANVSPSSLIDIMLEAIGSKSGRSTYGPGAEPSV